MGKKIYFDATLTGRGIHIGPRAVAALSRSQQLPSGPRSRRVETRTYVSGI